MAINQPGMMLTQPLEQRQRELSESLAWLDTILAGGTPEGFVPSLQNWGSVLGLLGNVAQQRGAAAIQPAMQRWVEPALGGALGRDLQHQAMSLLAATADQSGVDPRLMTFLSNAPSTIQGFGTRSDILTQLAPQFANQPWFQQLYANFLAQATPGGTTGNMPVPVWAAAAQPFFTMQNLMGGPEAYAQAGLPLVQFPSSAANMPRQAQDVIRAIHEASLASQGLQIGPQGVMTETPAELNRRIAAALGPLVNQGFGQTPDPTAGFSGWSPQAPAVADPQAVTQPKAGWMDTIRNALQRYLPGLVGAPVPGGQEVYNELRRAFSTPTELYIALLSYRPQNQEEAQKVRELQAWAMNEMNAPFASVFGFR